MAVARRLRRLDRREEEEKPEKGPRKAKKGKSAVSDDAAEAIASQLGDAAFKSKARGLALEEVKHFRKQKSRYPKGEEYEEIANTIYEQLKEQALREKILSEEKEGSGKGKRKKADEKSRGKEEADAKERLSPKERRELRRGRGSAEKEEKQKGIDEEDEEIPEEPVDVVSAVKEDVEDEADFKSLLQDDEDASSLKLNGLSDSDELNMGALNLDEDESAEIETLPQEVETDKNVCPNCRNKAEDIIFCPECGQGFCNHCAAKVEVQQDSVKYSCPKCKNEFKTRK